MSRKDRAAAPRKTPRAKAGRSKAASKSGTGPRLGDALAAWNRADWSALAELAEHDLSDNPDRARLAILAAAGLVHSGRSEAALEMGRQARDWGCPPRLMAEILIGGALDTAGRATCLLADAATAEPLFAEAVALFSPESPEAGNDRSANARDRMIRAQSALGLLPEARDVLEDTLGELQRDRRLSSAEAAMFRSQLDLLTHTLSLAQMRGQLNGQPGGPTAHTGGGTDTQLAQRAVSQLGQDLWVLEQTGYKRGGFFVEFGATDGVILSNTLLLETEFGWDGILAEPNPAFFARLRENRTCTLAPDCIMGETGQEVSFILADEYGGVADFAEKDAHVDRRRAFQEANHVLRLPTISLHDFLVKYKAPRRIDYLSIDTEGSEYEILRHFPFGEWDIRLLTVEHNFAPVRADIRALMESHGYRCQEAQWDDWYVRD